MLVHLICLARSLGIHLLIATQRPDRDILPGQLKDNLPSVICFKVKNETNSKICLDNNRAADLPSAKEIPGRAIWQHETEREVQTLHLPMAQARAMNKNYTCSTPQPDDSDIAGRLLTGEEVT